jgi:phosphate transport system permease protein
VTVTTPPPVDITLPPEGPPPPPAQPDPLDRPRELNRRSVDDNTSIVASFVGSLALVWLIYYQLLPLSGRVGFVICWYLGFLGLYAGVSSLGNPRPIVVDRLGSAAVAGAAGVVGVALASTVIYTVVKGLPALPHPNFYTHDMAGVGPQDPLTRGGISHAIVGSVIELAIATAVSLPLGIATAVYIVEVGGRLSRVVRTLVEAMTALPDILAGLFIYRTLLLALGLPRSGFAAGMALSIMMLPIIARSADVALRVVPGGLREASLALGATRWQTVRRVVLPTARSGLATAVILGMARAVGETAPLLIVSGASTFFNDNPFKNPMNSLPLFIFTAVRSGEPTYITRGFGAATVLLLLVVALFTVTRLLARQKTSR